VLGWGPDSNSHVTHEVAAFSWDYLGYLILFCCTSIAFAITSLLKYIPKDELYYPKQQEKNDIDLYSHVLEATEGDADYIYVHVPHYAKGEDATEGETDYLAYHVPYEGGEGATDQGDYIYYHVPYSGGQDSVREEEHGYHSSGHHRRNKK